MAPQVLAEFIHIVTDPRRFARPLDMTAARQLAEQWWTAVKSCTCSPMCAAARQFLAWLQQFSLGRKRLLDTLLAATYRQAGIYSLLTTDQADFLFSVSSPASHRGQNHEFLSVIRVRMGSSPAI